MLYSSHFFLLFTLSFTNGTSYFLHANCLPHFSSISVDVVATFCKFFFLNSIAHFDAATYMNREHQHLFELIQNGYLCVHSQSHKDITTTYITRTYFISHTSRESFQKKNTIKERPRQKSPNFLLTLLVYDFEIWNKYAAQ